jgi:hypothetical protein
MSGQRTVEQTLAKGSLENVTVNLHEIGYWYTIKKLAVGHAVYYHREKRDIESCCDSKGRGLEPN